MLDLIFKEIRYRFPYMFISILVYELCFYITESYHDMEMNFYIFPLVLCGMLFTNEYEIELVRTSNTRVSEFFVTRYIVTFLYIALLPCISVFIKSGDYREVLTLFTTLLFSTSFSFLIRSVISNPYATVLFAMFIHMLLVFSGKVLFATIFEITSSKTLQRLYPYYSYTISNKGVYGNNRIIVVSVAVFIILTAWFILRRKEKYYID